MMGKYLYKKIQLVLFVCFVWMTFLPLQETYGRDEIQKSKTTPDTYYISAAGNDTNNGSLAQPWKTLGRLNNVQLQPGDTIYLQGNTSFHETLHLRNITGSASQPVTIRTYGKADAIINSKDSAAIVLDSCAYLSLQRITVIGSGRKEGNVTNGISINNSSDIDIANIEVSGFQKAGLLVYNSSDVAVKKVAAHDNGFAGISISGEYGDKLHCRNIRILDCEARNNPGDPTNFDNHSGNGILAGSCTNVLIDHCTAGNNGWDMPRIGNGPVGIWCYEADSVIIQHCLSYNNKTSKGGEDGGGYDLDGGVTNSVIQYCLSYNNQGSGFGIFQYAGASPWHDNTIRYCISENDGNVSAAHANAYVWNSSHDSGQMKNLLFYNNTLYNGKGAAISYSVESDHTGFRFYNNIFVAGSKLIAGKDMGNDVFLANNWWSLKGEFNMDGFNQFKAWANTTGKEKLKGTIIGSNANPTFKKSGSATITDASLLEKFDDYTPGNISPLLQAGIGLQKLYNIQTGNIDFNGKALHKNFTGACAY